jgi:hypothetical protein
MKNIKKILFFLTTQEKRSSFLLLVMILKQSLDYQLLVLVYQIQILIQMHYPLMILIMLGMKTIMN